MHYLSTHPIAEIILGALVIIVLMVLALRFAERLGDIWLSSFRFWE